jgi:hypothetical protein
MKKGEKKNIRLLPHARRHRNFSLLFLFTLTTRKKKSNLSQNSVGKFIAITAIVPIALQQESFQPFDFVIFLFNNFSLLHLYRV